MRLHRIGRLAVFVFAAALVGAGNAQIRSFSAPVPSVSVATPHLPPQIHIDRLTTIGTPITVERPRPIERWVPINKPAQVETPIAKSAPPPTPKEHHVTAEERRYWLEVLKAFGNPTRSDDRGYVVIGLADDGRVTATTNFLRSGYSNAPVLQYRRSDFDNRAIFQDIESALFGNSDERSLKRTQLKILLDGDMSTEIFQKSLFDTEMQSFRFETNGYREAEVVFAGSKEGFIAKKFDREQLPPRWVAKLNDCCVVSGVPTRIERWDDLGRIPFSKGRTQVVSLAWDSATANVLRPAVRSGYVHPEALGPDPVRTIQSVFQSGRRGEPVVILGHVDGSEFVVERSGQVVSRIPFKTLTDMAVATQRPLVFLGCYTAEYFARHPYRDYSVGTLNLISSEAAARRLVVALGSASTFQEFLADVSSEDQYVWISNSFLSYQKETDTRFVRAPIFQEYRHQGGLFRSIVGFLYVLLPCKWTGGCA